MRGRFGYRRNCSYLYVFEGFERFKFKITVMSHPTNQEFLEYWTDFYLSQGHDLERAIELAENELNNID